MRACTCRPKSRSMLARRALERRRAAIAGGIAASIAGFTLASRYSDQQRRPLQGCEADTVSAAISSLKTSGVSVMRDLIDQETLTAVQASSVYKDMPMTMPSRAGHARSHAGGARRDGTSAGVPVQSAWRASAMGRLHRREESFDDSDQKVFERVEKLIWPLVKAECQASYRSVGGWYSNRGFGAIKAMRRFRGTAAKPHRCTLIPQP